MFTMGFEIGEVSLSRYESWLSISNAVLHLAPTPPLQEDVSDRSTVAA